MSLGVPQIQMPCSTLCIEVPPEACETLIWTDLRCITWFCGSCDWPLACNMGSGRTIWVLLLWTKEDIFAFIPASEGLILPKPASVMLEASKFVLAVMQNFLSSVVIWWSPHSRKPWWLKHCDTISHELAMVACTTLVQSRYNWGQMPVSVSKQHNTVHP